MAAESALLSCEGLTVRFGGVLALDRVRFSVPKGAIAAIIGPNGAGKTTLLNAVTGLVPLESGTISFRDRELTRLPVHKRAKAGVIRTFQNLEIFSNMSVLENVLVGCHRRIRYSVLAALCRGPAYFRAERKWLIHAEKVLEFVGLSAEKNHPAQDLPFGKQRLLELARAVAAEPELLLLDEPAAGLNMKETRVLGQVIRAIRDELGMTVALVEHDMDLVMDISDEITVLQFGQELTKGSPHAVQNDPRVIEAYLGAEDEPGEPGEPDESGEPGQGASEGGRAGR